jgi:hypothetical protein
MWKKDSFVNIFLEETLYFYLFKFKRIDNNKIKLDINKQSRNRKLFIYNVFKFKEKKKIEK